MSDDVSSIRKELRAVGSELSRKSQEYEQLLEQRGKFVSQARAAGMTWREIAGFLGMTEKGLIQSQRSWEKRAGVSGR